MIGRKPQLPFRRMAVAMAVGLAVGLAVGAAMRFLPRSWQLAVSCAIMLAVVALLVVFSLELRRDRRAMRVLLAELEKDRRMLDRLDRAARAVQPRPDRHSLN